MMPLSLASSGEKMVIKQINGKDETKRFLENLGFVVGGNVIIVSEMCGNVIVNIKDTRIAISKTMANRIMVD